MLFISIFSSTTVEANAESTKNDVDTGMPFLVRATRASGATTDDVLTHSVSYDKSISDAQISGLGSITDLTQRRRVTYFANEAGDEVARFKLTWSFKARTK